MQKNFCILKRKSLPKSEDFEVVFALPKVGATAMDFCKKISLRNAKRAPGSALTIYCLKLAKMRYTTNIDKQNLFDLHIIMYVH